MRSTRNAAQIDSTGVLTIGKLGTGQEAYYLDSVAGGIEDYYGGEGEASGRWVGSGAEGLGLSGEVESTPLRRILTACHPETGLPLASRRGGLRVPGFDLTFSAPKSVSLLWALGEPATRQLVSECHDRAVEASLGYIEREAARVRRGAGGAQTHETEGLIAAAFRHRSSRAGDPQLHTHVLIANLAKGPDGRYSALDGSRIYHHAKSGGYLYQAQLRAELRRELGVCWQPMRRGAAELAGISDEVLRTFSQRRAEIVQAMAAHGTSSPRAAQVAALDSRRAKEYDVGAESLHERWRRRARELGAEVSMFEQGRSHGVDEGSRVEHLALAVTAERSDFDRRNVIEAICERSPEGVEVARAEQIADAFLASPEVVALADSALGPRFTTPEILALEQRVIEACANLHGAERNLAPSQIVENAIERRPGIGADQAEMVRRLCGDGDGIAIVIGRPGTGKTYALSAAAEAWTKAGISVRGAAPTRAAAAEIEASAGIESVSVAALLAELDERASNLHGLTALSHGCVLVIDEAAMVGTRSIARLLDHAEAAEAKLVLVGDHRQLPELEAGGLFRALAGRTDAIELSEVRRHRHALDRDNVERIRQGRGAEAFELYRSEERVVIAADADARRRAMVSDWWGAFAESPNAVMIAKRNADVAELNAGARKVMRSAGALGEREVEVAGEPFAAGDVVLTRVNSSAHGVANRMRWRVEEIREDGSIELRRLSDERRAVLDPAYLARVNPQSGAPALQHGYAGTIYVAQGGSVERAFVAAEAAMSLEEFNTALSRSVGETYIYAVAAPEIEREEYAPHQPQERDPLDQLVGSMERPRAQLAAIDEAVRAPLHAVSSGELVERVESFRRESSDQRNAEIATLEAELAERRRLTVAAARLCPPSYVREAIGERPEPPRARHRWETGLQEIERYRQAHGVSDPGRALGQEPRQGFERAAYQRTQNRIASLQRELGRRELSPESSQPFEIAQ